MATEATIQLKGKTKAERLTELNDLIDQGVDAETLRIIKNPIEREKLLNPAEDSGNGTGEPATPPAPGEPAVQDPPAPSGDTGKPSGEDDYFGYGSKEDAKNGFENLHSALKEKQAAIDKFNAERGVLGQKTQRMEQQMADMTAKLAELTTKGAPPPATPPAPSADATLPDLPDMPDYPEPPEDGYTEDPKHQQKLKEFAGGYKDYKSKMRDYLKEMPATIRKQATAEFKSQTSQFEEFMNQQKAKEQESVETALNTAQQKSEDFFFEGISQFQEKNKDFATKYSIRDIDAAVQADGIENAKTRYPATDIERYQNLREISKNWGYVDNGIFKPHPVFAKTGLKGAYNNFLLEQGKFDQNQQERELEAKREAEKNLQAAQGTQLGAQTSLPNNAGSQVGESTIEQMDGEQVKKRAVELLGMGVDAIQQNPKLMEEYTQILRRLGGKGIPSLKPLR